MSRPLVIFLALALSSVSSCQDPKPSDSDTPPPIQTSPAVSSLEMAVHDKPAPKPVDKAALVQDFNTWYNYHYYNIKLSQPFTGLNADSTPLSKARFLLKLSTGEFVAFKENAGVTGPVYRLYRPRALKPTIKSTLKQLAENELNYVRMEGKPMPKFACTDLKGHKYTSANTRGKTLVLKCWFIGCVACVKEFPELNRLTEDFTSRQDVLFVSLALDPETKLRAFLQHKTFNYAVVAQQGAYLKDQLDVRSYPTHVLVDGHGIIVKVAGNAADLRAALEKQVQRPAM